MPLVYFNPFSGRYTALLLLQLLVHTCFSNTAHAASDAEFIDGFNRTVFGSEYTPFGYQSDYIRKFTRPVRFYIHDMARLNRRGTVRAFILSLNNSIQGLQTRITESQHQANFNVYIVDRKDYERIVREKVYRNSSAQTPGRCLVRSVYSRAGIQRSDAVIVSNEGESLFKRCTTEEILQGLGPLNEHDSLVESVFNDRSNHTGFTRFDRIILNMLYDRRLVVGSSRQSVQHLLPVILQDVKRRIR
jgi:hypothetical protein